METQVLLLPYAYLTEKTKDKLVVRYRVYVAGRWRKNGFWIFPLPCHEEDLIERAYIEFNADQAYIQRSFDIISHYGMFYSRNTH